MKIQELAIIFIIIILPISLLLSEFTQLQIKTINTQSIYDAKLTAATYDAIKAFQLNATNSSHSDMKNPEMRDIEASVAAFRNSIMSAFELNGYTKTDINNYIPALIYTLYDGFYIYSPYKNTHDETGNLKTGELESIYGLKPYISYSCRYIKGNIDVVITYALDNYITVRGTIDGKYVNKSGYLIDGITKSGDDTNYTITYNGITIESEHLKENVLNETYSYAKINGQKYYLMENYLDGNTDCIVYIDNGTPKIQAKEGEAEFIVKRNQIQNNISAKQYYKEAKEFTEWLKSNLKSLTYGDAIDEVINEDENDAIPDGSTSLINIWSGDTRQIFVDSSHNIENELSSFNQHRLAVIRHKIETNLAIAIANYNSYSGIAATNQFEMPELKEDEWENITNKISLISFLQGLPMGGKKYNGYSIVTNSESEKVVLEENIYLLGEMNNYHRIGDMDLEGTTPSINVDAGSYEGSADGKGKVVSAGRLNLDFERNTFIDEIKTFYYYPLKSFNASYNSIVMQNNVTTYDDIYEYVNNQSKELKTAFYTALGRERYSLYKPETDRLDKYNILVVGYTPENRVQGYKTKIQNIANELNKDEGINAAFMFSSNFEKAIDYAVEQKHNYNMIIFDTYVWWEDKVSNSEKLAEIANATNLITISNDAVKLDTIMESSTSSNGVTKNVIAKMTEDGKKRLGDIANTYSLNDTQAVIKFKDNVKVFMTGEYTGGVIGDLVGCYEGENYKWIHSQASLNSDNMKILKPLINYILNN